jgi:hypothetical protein
LVPIKDKLVKWVEKVKKYVEDIEDFVEEGFEEDDEKETC